MEPYVFYETIIKSEEELEELQQVLDVIFEELNPDDFEISRCIGETTYHVLTALNSVGSSNVVITIRDSFMDIACNAINKKALIGCKLILENITEKNLRVLKEKIILLSKNALISKIKNQEMLEQMLKEKIQKLNKELVKSAYFDNLTKLPNRSNFYDRFDEIISFSFRNKVKFALMFIDLDDFKHVNDTYGHDAGDIVLKTFASSVKRILRKEDIIARMGGDEFAAIIKESKDKRTLSKIAEKIIKTAETPIKISKYIYAHVSASVGIVIFPDDADNKNELLKLSDICMYKVKKSGKGSYLFYQR